MNPEVYQSRFKIPPYRHQAAGVRDLLNNEAFALWWEMGTGKSKAVVDAACILACEEEIKGVLVVCPSAVKSVWSSQIFGQIKEHCWLPGRVWEFHSSTKAAGYLSAEGGTRLDWIVTNYEYIRNKEHRERLEGMLRQFSPFLMVCDESAFIKSRTAEQTKACIKLGEKASRRVVLNGTPIANNPLDLWSQARFLGAGLLPFKNFYHFRSEFAVLGGFQGRQVVQWKNLDRLQDLMRPFSSRVEKKDCMDLPPKVYTQVEVQLSEESWKIYKEMRDEACAWLGENPSLAAQAGVRVMRLAQITAGFLGGVVQVGDDLTAEQIAVISEIGREKLDAFIEWVKARLEEDPKRKMVAWCRFRPELERCAKELSFLLPTYKFYGQTKKQRRETEESFSKDTPGPALQCAQVQAGGLGQNWAFADVEAYLSNDYSFWYRKQSEDRLHRGGQTKSVLVADFLATGPKGQRTIDHVMVKAVHGKEDISQWTCAGWKRALEEE